MRALEIKRNGATLAIIGAPNALMFSADIAASIQDEAATLDIRGMNELDNERQSHTTWLELDQLDDGDRVEFSFVEVESATPPMEEVATDSPEHQSSQAEYEAQLQTEPLVPRELEQRRPDAALRLRMEGHEQIVATLESGREFLSCRFLWNRWRPERCRVSLSSFSQKEALARSGSREWFSGALSLGESCVVEVGA